MKLDQMSNFIMLNVGTMLDSKYEIKREIARGGMSIVYEAYHKYTYKRVAIKVIPTEEVERIQLGRFHKELEAYSLLSHPNVITIYDAGICNNPPYNYLYIVMEYIEGVDICTYVKQYEEKKTLEDSENKSDEPKERDWKLCARLIYETALGLDYIHSQKMIHRDIKPANIIIRPNGSPIIIDLGLVKFNRKQSYNLTRSKEIIGTLEYMPIEQFQGKKSLIDARTDVYSLGLVLYELLTGKVAYDGENIMESCYKIICYYPPLPRKINPKIPEALEKITLHAIEKQKEKRYASMKEFADDLKQYLDDTVTKPNYEQRAEQGDADAQYFLGNQYYLGRNVPQDNKKAIYWWKKAANQGHADAQSNLGAMYYYGKCVTQDDKKAFYWFEQSAYQGFAKAQYNLGVMYKNGKGVARNYAKAVYWFEQSANQRYAEAQYNLGAMYYYGKGVTQNIEKAVYWLEQVANQGHSEAQCNLGVMYLKGKGVTQNFEKAIYWFEKAANQENADAQCNLGAMYYYGKGTTQDYAKAIYWLEQSANQGYSEAQYNLGIMYLKGKGVTQDIKKAVYWFEKLANQEYAEIQYKLGVMYLKGNGVTQDIEKAVYWLQKAANQGIAYSQYKLGFMYCNGEGVTQDTEKAMYWLEKAAKQGDSSAQCFLGKHYHLGKKLPQDTQRAVYWLQKAKTSKNMLIATKASKILEDIEKEMD